MRFRINEGQLKIVMGTKLGTSVGGLEVLRQQYPLRQVISSLHSHARICSAAFAMPSNH